MLNIDNGKQISESVGKGLSFENERDMQMRGYIRFKAELAVSDPISPGFWWTNDCGEEKWEHLKYERLSDLCYGCGRLGHTSQMCNLEIATSEVNGRLSMYGSWISCPRQRKLSAWFKPGGGKEIRGMQRDPTRKKWQDMMKEGRSEVNQFGGADKLSKSESAGSCEVPANQAHPAPAVGVT